MLKFNNILKILSLGIGLAIGCILIAKVCFESSYDNFYKGLERIYLIKPNYSLRGEVNESDQVSGGIAPGFKKYVPGVESATRTTFLFESEKFYTEEKALVTGTLVPTPEAKQPFEIRYAGSGGYRILRCLRPQDSGRKPEGSIGSEIQHYGKPFVCRKDGRH